MRPQKRRTRHSKKRKVSRKTRVRRGGGDLALACKIPQASGFPEARTNDYDELDDATIDGFKAFIQEKIPSESSFFILKIGSNDSEDVARGTYSVGTYGQSSGSKGRRGAHYLEIEGAPNEPSLLKVLKDDKGEISGAARKFIPRFITNLPKTFFTSMEKKGFLLSVSPIPSYFQYEYPFINATTEDLLEGFFDSFASLLSEKQYLQSLFPLTAKGRNKEILDIFVNRPEPLVLFNAMASSCYRSMKYIIDMRRKKGYKTLYMGLCDTFSPSVDCAISSPIYPDPKTACKNFI